MEGSGPFATTSHTSRLARRARGAGEAVLRQLDVGGRRAAVVGLLAFLGAVFSLAALLFAAVAHHPDARENAIKGGGGGGAPRKGTEREREERGGGAPAYEALTDEEAGEAEGAAAGGAPPTGRARPAVQLDVSRLSIALRTSEATPILSDVSARFAPNSLTVLLGPSGSGKTTLLNAIAGRTPSTMAATEGAILANGTPLLAGGATRGLVSYVPQDVVLLPSLTVAETLRFSARLLGEVRGRAERDDATTHRVVRMASLEPRIHHHSRHSAISLSRCVCLRCASS